MEYKVYALKSLIAERIYVGMSSNPARRLQEHNGGHTKSTRPYRPWKIIYVAEVGSRVDARKEEKRLKRGYGREFLKSIENSAVAQR